MSDAECIVGDANSVLRRNHIMQPYFHVLAVQVYAEIHRTQLTGKNQ